MNKGLLALAAAVTICFTACAQKKDGQKQEPSKVLVAYFSAAGTTARVAADLAEVAEGKLCGVVPETAYIRNILL